MDLAEAHEGVKIHFNTRCTGMDLQTGTVFLVKETGKELLQARGETVIGTDGSASALRNEMMKHGRFNFSQQYLEHGYKELTIPPDEKGDFRMDPGALHIWPRGSFMMIALPNPDRSVTCTLFFPFSGEYGFDALDHPDKIMDFFRREFPD